MELKSSKCVAPRDGKSNLEIKIFICHFYNILVSKESTNESLMARFSTLLNSSQTKPFVVNDI